MTVRFVKKVIIFLCIPLLLLAILTWMLQVANSRLFESYRLNGDIQTVLIGDSHIEMGIDDRLFPGSVNLAKSSDGYIYSYAKLKIILTTHPQIRRVLLGYSYHNLSSYFNTFIDGRDARYGFAEYFFVLPGAEKLLLMKRNRLVGIHAMTGIIKNGFGNLTADSSRFSFLGSYQPKENQLEDTATIHRRIIGQFYNKGSLKDFSDIQLTYLQKIIDLCEEKKVKLVLLNTPLHPLYLQQVPATYKHLYHSAIKNRPVTLIECNDFDLPDSLYMPDGDHLNSKGADTVTRYLYNKLGLY